MQVLHQDERRRHITIALGDLSMKLKVEMPSSGVPMTLYTFFYNLEASYRVLSFTPVGA